MFRLIENKKRANGLGGATFPPLPGFPLEIPFDTLPTTFIPGIVKDLELELDEPEPVDEELLVVKFGIVLNIMQIIDIVIKI